MSEAKVVPGAEPAVIPDVCPCMTCVLARMEQNVFFAEPEPEEAPEMPTQDYPLANVLPRKAARRLNYTSIVMIVVILVAILEMVF